MHLGLIVQRHRGATGLTLSKSSSVLFLSRGGYSRPSPQNTWKRFSSNSSQLEASVPRQTPKRVLQGVPLSILLRSLTVLSVAALPQSLLSAIIRTTKKCSGYISSSPILRWPVHQTFYKTFCIGSEKRSIETNITALRAMGLDGIVLAFARESKFGGAERPAGLTKSDPSLQEWVSMNLETIDCLTDKDYLALRLTGAGQAAVAEMDHSSQRSLTSVDHKVSLGRLEVFRDALDEIFTAASRKGVKVLIDAESSSHQPAIDHLALAAMSKFNTGGKAVIYNTYQMYLKSGVNKMIKHLKVSKDQGFTIGLKLVRGAYLHVEPNVSALHDSKEDTDNGYDDAVKFLLGGTLEEGSYDTDGAAALKVSGSKPWNAEIMLATHNQASVDKALSRWKVSGHTLPTMKSPNGGTVQSLSFAQLMGMADEVSLGLVSEGKESKVSEYEKSSGSSESLPPIGVYKYTIWGSFEECLLYMLRRAEENQDAVARTRGTAVEVVREIGRRVIPF
ncbi:FAD-linked oxidoreductase-like protein [Dactylonectria macrodidyma]|uniref:Proline dehydrogenase n=1 Tax=Dactylonectria macrodidyma TaxID=307937 RepID=A0A9P9EFD3_9HYPO|nr:FAD-linked oxidoreductase-like protein [Dactylonectria macrodidyma]